MSHASKDQPRDRRTTTPVAIVGMGCLFPKAEGPTSYWANILAGLDATGEIPPTHWRPEDYFSPDPSAPDRTYARRGGFLEPVEFEPLKYGLNPNALEATDTTQLLGLMVAEYALRDAGYALDDDQQADGPGAGKRLDRERTSCILGVTGALELVVSLGARLGHPHWRRALREAGIDDRLADQIVARIAENYVPWQENSFPGLLGNVAAGRIANRFDLRGTNCVVDAACASSLSAIHTAIMELELGRADTVVAGGLDTFNDIFMYLCFSKTPALSPTGDCRPYSQQADGTLLGEGLGVLVLKRLDDAREQGDRIYAVIRGVGSSSDGRGNAIYAPSVEGQVRALEAAYRSAGVSPATIELIEGHGTGTKVGDAVELEALCRVFRQSGREGRWCAIGSVKSMIGHTKAAAGVAGLMKATLALHHKVLPPTIKVARPAAACAEADAPVYVNTESRPWLPRPTHPRRAGVSAFGFGGSNFHCVLEEAEPRAGGVFWDGRDQVIPFAADDRRDLTRQVIEFRDALRGARQPWRVLRARAAACRQQFNPDAAQRLVVVVGQQDPSEPFVPVVLEAAIRWLEHPQQARRKPSAMLGTASGSASGEGDFFFDDRPPGRLAMLFPGQGSQRVGMLRELACRFPVVLDALAEMNDVFAQQQAADDRRLSDLVFPLPALDDEQRKNDAARLRDTRTAQPALAAMEWGAYGVLRQLGVRADAMAGHSFGELVALCAAGCFEADELFRVAVQRGRLMAEAAASSTGAGPTGAMLAVSATAEEIGALVAEEKLAVHLANWNAPRQIVYSGDAEAIGQLEAALKRRRIGSRRLAVSAAFHSPAMQGAADRWAAALERVAWRKSATPVLANVTGQPYPTTARDAKRLLAEQLVRPVQFVETIENLYSSGIRTFLEVGPGTVLCGLVRQTLGQRPHAAVALDASRGRRAGLYDLAMAVGQLAALGHRLDWSAWDPEASRLAAADAQQSNGRRKSLTITLCGANYVKPRPSASENTPASTNGGGLPEKVVERRHQGQQTATTDDHRPAERTLPEASAAPREEEEMAGRRRSTFQQVPDSGSTMHDPHEEQKVRPTAGQHAPPAREPAVGNGVAPATAATDQHRAANPPLAARAALPVAGTGDGTQRSQLANEALRFSQQAIVTFQKLQEQTAALHRQYLEGQEAAQRDLAELIRQQQRLLLQLSEGAVPTESLSTPQGAPPQRATTADGDRHAATAEPRARGIAAPAEAAAALPERQQAAASARDVTDAVGTDGAPRSGQVQGMAQSDAAAGGDRAAASLGAEPMPVEAMADEPAGAHEGAAPTADGSNKNKGVLPVLLAVVAEKTGYPTDVLDADMSLDDDLGIDSIKRVEILSELQDRLPRLPSIEAEQLNAWSTLREIADFLDRHLPTEDAQDTQAAATEPTRTATGETTTTSAVVAESGLQDEVATQAQCTGGNGPTPANGQRPERLAEVLLDVVAEKTGYPTDMLELDMQLDAELGIDSIKRVEILSELKERVPSLPEIGSEGLGSMETLRDIVALLGALDKEPAGAASEGGQPSDTAAGAASGETFDGQPTQAATDVPSSPTSDTTAAVLLEVVAEKTGYPTDMLELDMQLDAELGIDSIKRVEIFSELQDRLPQMPTIEAEQLGALQTLQEIVDHLTRATAANKDELADSATDDANNESAQAGRRANRVCETPGSNRTEGTEGSVESQADARPPRQTQARRAQGKPEEAKSALSPSDGSAAGRTETRDELASPAATSDTSMQDIAPDEGAALKAYAVVWKRVANANGSETPGASRESREAGAAARAEGQWSLERLAHGTVWVIDEPSGLAERIVAALRERGLAADLVSDPAASEPANLSGVIVVAPVEAELDFLTTTFRWLKRLGPALRRAAAEHGAALLAAVSQVDGRFGLPESAADGESRTGTADGMNWLSGGLAGVVKTAAAEWPEVACRVIDIPPVGRSAGGTLDDWAQRIVGALTHPGPIELGLAQQAVSAPGLVAIDVAAAADDELAGPLEAGDLVVVSGGARGVTAEAVVALAEAMRPRLLLLGRSELPEDEPDWLAGVDDQPAAIKAAIARHSEAKRPREIERVFRDVVRAREIRATLARVKAAGAPVEYRTVDICDGAAVRDVVEQARQRFGPVRGIVHGAGILADRLIEDLDEASFERVVSTKVDGLRHLLAAARDDRLRVLAVFSSSTARFGRKGQIAYAAANEVLNKMAQREAKRRPDCRVRSINWGPWDGGMVTDALKQQFARERIGVIPLRAGGRHLVEQLCRSDAPVESVVVGAGSSASFLGGANAASAPDAGKRPTGATPAVRWSLAFQRRVSVETCPVLRSHVLNHRAVLPMALMVEWLAHGALHDNFSLRFHGFDDLRVFKGVRLEGDEAVDLGVWVAPPQLVASGEANEATETNGSSGSDGHNGNETLRVDVELRCGEVLHARGRMVLVEALPERDRSGQATTVEVPEGQTHCDVLDSNPYDDGRLFHGPELHGIRRVYVCDEKRIVADVATAPGPGSWLQRPLRSTWLADPLALDAAFQLMVLWSCHQTGHRSLPTRAEGYRQFLPTFPAEGVRVDARVLRHTEHALTATIEWRTSAGELVARLDRYHAVIDASLAEAFARNRLLEGVHG